jgi:thiaminase
MKLNPSAALALILATVLTGALASPAAASGGSSNNQARRLVEELRRDLAPIENEIRNHPYLTALENHQVPRSNLRAFAGEQYHIIQSDLRSAAQLVARYGATPSGPFFQGILEGEIIARDHLLRFAAALGWDERDLKTYEPNPQAQTYPSYVTWMSVHASDAQVATSYLVNFAVFGENLGRMAAALRSRYGFSAADTAYFDFFATLPPDFEPNVLSILEAGLAKGADVREIKRSARLLQAYELDFWDAVAEN